MRPGDITVAMIEAGADKLLSFGATVLERRQFAREAAQEIYAAMLLQAPPVGLAQVPEIVSISKQVFTSADGARVTVQGSALFRNVRVTVDQEIIALPPDMAIVVAIAILRSVRL